MLASTLACRDVTLDPNKVIALEMATTTPLVEQGDTLRLTAVPLNAAGNPVSDATVTWVVVDTGVTGMQVDPSGLIHASFPDTARVQANADGLRSDPITVTVTAFPDTAAASGPTAIVLPATDVQSASLAVTVYSRSTAGALTGIQGKIVSYQVVQPANASGFFLTVSDSVPGKDPLHLVTQTASGGQATVVVRRRLGETPPDSVVVDATAQTSRGATVPGTPVRFTVVLQ